MNDLLDIILLGAGKPPGDEVHAGVVSHHVAKRVRYDCFTSLVDNSFDLCTR